MIKMIKIKSVKYNVWDDTVNIEYKNGLCYQLPLKKIKSNNKIKDNPKVAKATPIHNGNGFTIIFKDGQRSENSWLYALEVCDRVKQKAS